MRNEILNILPDKNSQLTPEKMKNMPYLRSVIKESFRLYPVVNGNGRTLMQDVNLSGYLVPKGTHIAMLPVLVSRNEKQYPEPNKFLPERWLREKTSCPHTKTAHPFAFLPFGFGARSCIGRRLAELEMESLLANIIRNFKLEWHYSDLKVNSLFINIPITEMKFKVVDLPN